jgi:DNA segregation ATPase FtsK/SpoIIIE-like protein
LPAPSSDDGLIREPGRLTATLGLMDDPAHQVQIPWSVDLGRDGNLLVIGTRGSGKTGTLLQLAIDLADHQDASDLHVYAIDSGTGSLKALEALPHCGGVVAAADHERLHRLFTRLTTAMHRRREELAMSGTGDFLAWRQHRQQPDPWVLVLVDDYAAFKENADTSGLGVLNDSITNGASSPSRGTNCPAELIGWTAAARRIVEADASDRPRYRTLPWRMRSSSARTAVSPLP